MRLFSTILTTAPSTAYSVKYIYIFILKEAESCVFVIVFFRLTFHRLNIAMATMAIWPHFRIPAFGPGPLGIDDARSNGKAF